MSDEATKSALLEAPFTADYEPYATHGYGYYSAIHSMPVFTPFWIPLMLRDQRIQFGLRMIKGPILAASRFYVDDDESKGDTFSPLKKFIVKNLTRFWRFSAVKALRAIEWGYSGNEALYKLKGDQIHFDTLKILQPFDVRVLTKDGDKVGISVQKIKGRRGKVYLGGPKGLWHCVNREDYPWYGQSRLFGAFVPWMEFYGSGGAKDIRRLYYHKYAFTGDVGYYPTDTTPGPAGEYPRSPKEIMRSILEKRKTGGVVAFPNVRDENGNPRWVIEPGHSTGSSVDILEYHRMLKGEMTEGMGIPTEVMEAAEVGSGWSGRMVPATAFFAMLQEYVNWLIFDFDQQIMRPLVELNFGIKDPDYEIIPFGLLRGPGDEEENEKEAQIGQMGQSQFAPGSQNENRVPQDRRESAQFSLCV